MTPPAGPMGDGFDAVRARNRELRTPMTGTLVVAALVLVVLGGGLLVTGHGRVVAELHEASIGPSVEVTAIPNACAGRDDCVTEFVDRRPNGEVNRRTWIAGDIAPGTTRNVPTRETGGGVLTGETCCRDDLLFPVAAIMFAVGIGWLVAVRPGRRDEDDAGTTFVPNAPGRVQSVGVAALFAAPVGLGILSLDLQTAGPWAFTWVHAAPSMAVLAAVTTARWTRRLTIEPDRLTLRRAWGPQRSVQLGPHTTVRTSRGMDGSVGTLRVADGRRRLRLRVPLWGDVDHIGARLHDALVRAGVRGDHRELRRPPDLRVNARQMGRAGRRFGP